MILSHTKSLQFFAYILAASLLFQSCSSNLPIASKEDETYSIQELRNLDEEVAKEEKENKKVIIIEESANDKRQEIEVAENNNPVQPSDQSLSPILPREIWKHIIYYLPSKKLHQAREINSVFDKYVKDVLEAQLKEELKNSDINAKDGEGKKTRLHLAVQAGNILLVKLLIDNGADVNAQDIYLDTPLHKAASQGYLEIVQLLLDQGADVNPKDMTDLPYIPGETPTAGYQPSDKPLHNAAREGHLPIVQLLINKGADVNASGGWRSTPLHYAATNGHLAIVQLLIDNRADFYAKDRDFYNPVHYAAEKGYLEVVQLFIDKGFDVKPKDNFDRPVLDAAKRGDHPAIVQLLIDNGADATSEDAEMS